MRNRVLFFVIWGLLLGQSPAGFAVSPLGEALKDIETAPHWIYDDWQAALQQAKTSGKPLLVVLRCVPCPPGRSLDQQVMQPDEELESLEKQFVCVRLIQANNLDLNLFQYDYDMSWAAMFLAPDLTIYGRYGTRNASGPESDALLSADGFRKAAERALKLHESFPKNKAQLGAKTGKPPEYRRPREIPGLQDRPAKATARQNCIHCHMVKEYALRAKWEEGRLAESDLWVYPMPERIGLTMDVDDGLRVKSVAEGSASSEAGIRPGDELISLQGQPLISMADIQWVLHNAPNDVRLPVTLRRAGQEMEMTISLTGDWKKSDVSWRASSWYGLRQGVKFEPVSTEEKRRRGIREDQLALAVKGLFGKGGPKVREAGVQMNDIIIAADGKTDAMDESDFLVWLRLNHGPQDSLRLTILRGDDRRELTVPLW
jgi:hypothetical protein